MMHYNRTWNRNGSLFATNCIDKHIRVIEPDWSLIDVKKRRMFVLLKIYFYDFYRRELVYQGPMTQMLCFWLLPNRLLSTGFGKHSNVK
jgi:hypothetical protein